MPRDRPVLLAVLVAAVALAPVVGAAAAAPAVGGADATDVHSDAASQAQPAGAQSVSGTEQTAFSLTPRSADVARTVVVSQPNTSSYLGIRDEAVQQSGQDSVSLNVGSAIQQDVTELESEYTSLTFEQRYENTTGRQARLDVIRSEVDRLERRVQELELRRNRVINSYNDGDYDTEAFLQELASLDVAARGMESEFDRVRGAAGLGLPSDIDTKLDNLEGDLLTLHGPVRQQIGGAMSGARDPLSVYTVTSQTGVVLAAKEGSLYYREAYLGQNRNQVGTNEFVTEDDPSGISNANTRATQLYPWVYDNYRSGPNVEPIGNTSIYYVQLGHPHGSLDTYLDGRSGDAFREYQTKPLDALPTRQTTNVSSNVRLTINRTHATGPMEIVVTDNLTGESLDATVTVNGHDVGSTGDDGRLWTLTPQRSVRITVTTESGRTVHERFFSR
ncbi:PspA/IM30 family protein [Halosimplex salinum]|uniref:PspA/IM30 family protein n=1 Tax=Halosimplex salinum TaxID=1710538 RepID=UPI000F465443|nr:hypothetical protein [Halosimplex salinum]